MIRWVDALLLTTGLTLLAACTSTATLPQAGLTMGAIRSGTGIEAGIGADAACAGSGGVQVTPCPIRLTKHTRGGIVVTVSGPGVVTSYLKTLNECHHDRLCYNAEREGNSETQWRFSSGRDCGSADVEMDGVDALGQTVGAAFLKLTNRDCR